MRIHGTHYGEPGIMIGNIKDIPSWYFNGMLPFKQTIYFNPMAVSGNFKYRSRIWFWNKHVPASNTGGDFIGKVLIDYEGNGDLWEYDYDGDRTTGAYDYAPIVEDWYNSCKEEYDKGELTEKEFYEKLFTLKVEATIWIATKERTLCLYPDDLDSLHEQKIKGRLGKDRTDIEMNVIFPKLSEVSEDTFKNYTELGTKLFKDCDRLRWVPENLFDTLIDQKTIESWFENSAIINVSSYLFAPLTELEVIDYAFKNSQIRTVEDKLFYYAPKIKSAIGTWENCKKLTKVGKEVIYEVFRYPVEEITFVNAFSGCDHLFLPFGTKIRDIFYTLYNTKVHTYNMLNGVYVYNTDVELMEDIIYWDGKPTNAILISEASKETEGLNCITLTYEAKTFVPINSIKLIRANGENSVEEVTHTSQLKGRLVIDVNGRVTAYDPATRPVPIPEINIERWDWYEGEKTVIKIYSPEAGDLFGIHLMTLNYNGIEDPYLIEDKVRLTIDGALPKTDTPTRFTLLYNQLQKIEDTEIFFKYYDSYNVEGMFYELYWLDLNNDYKLFRPLTKQTTFKNCFKDNKVFKTVNNMLATNTLVTTVEGMFENNNLLQQFQMRIFDNLTELRSCKNTFKNCPNLVINNLATNILLNCTKIETLSGMFDGCILLNNRLKTDHLINCTDFSFMYRYCEKLDLTNIEIADVDWKNSDVLTKFGKLKDINLLPDWADETKDINLESMLEGCVLTKVYRHVLYEKVKKSIRFNIKNMFKGLVSPFTDKYLFKDLNVTGESGITTYVPEQRITLTLQSFEVRINHMLRKFGSVKNGSSTALSNVSMDNNVFYPEYNGEIEVDWGDGNTEVISYRPNAKLRATDRIEASRVYLDPDNGIDGDLATANLDIEIYSKTLNNITHRYSESLIGKDITITLKNRFIPLCVTFGGTIKDFDGELPWGRVELLDTSYFKTVSTIHKNLFNNMFLSTNTGLRNYSDELETESLQYSLFNEFNNLETVENGLFAPLSNISVLGPVFTNSTKLYELPPSLFETLKNCYSAEFTYFGCTKLRYPCAIPETVRLLYATHAYTDTLTSTWNTIGELPELRRACHTFAGATCEKGTLSYAPFANSPKLTALLYTFRNSNVVEFPDFIFRTLYNLEVAIGVFAGTSIDTVRYNPFPEAKNLRIIDELYMGSSVKSYDAGTLGSGGIISANNVFKDCANLTSVNEDFLKNNRDLSSLIGFFENCKSLKEMPNILYTMNKVKIINRMFMGCEGISSVPEDYFMSVVNLISAEYLFSRTPFKVMPENIFYNINRLESIEGMFKDCKNLTEVKHLGIKVDLIGSGFNMKYLFKGCNNLEWHYHKFPDIISPKTEGSLPLILIQGCLYNIEAKYSDNELADGKFTIVGLSESLYRPDASIDTYNMNKFTMMVDLESDYKTSWKAWSYNDKTKMVTIDETLDLIKTNRVVFDIDGTFYGFDKRIEPDAELPHIDLKAGSHIISIYTEGINEIDNDDTINSELIILDAPAGTPITLQDNMPVGPQDTETNIRKLKLSDIFGTDANIIDIFDCNFIVSNGNPSWLPSKYFMGMKFNRVSLDKLPLRNAYLESMFQDCINLVSVTATKPVESGIIENSNMTNMFKGCVKLKNIPNYSITNLFPAVNKLGTKYTIELPIIYDSMFEGCTSLTKVPKVIDFVYKGVSTIQFSLASDEASTRISLRNMFKGCSSLHTIDGIIIEDTSNTFTNTTPTYNLTSMFESCGSLTKLPARVFTFSNVSNASTWSKCFQNCINLETIYKPLMSVKFSQVYFDRENNMELGYFLGGCTKLTWERTKMKIVIELPDATAVPTMFNSFGMLENVVSFLKDDAIFEGFKYNGATLAIYEDRGPSINGMNRFTMFYDVKKQYDGQTWQFRLWGPTKNNTGYQDVTGLKSSSLNGRVVLIFNDKGGSEDAVEYNPDDPITIQTHRVGEPDTPYATLPEVDGKEVVRLKIDIYTDKKLEDFTIYEFLGTVRPTSKSDVVNLVIDGSLGRSDKFSAKGLMLKEILGTDAVEWLTEIGPDLLEQNPNIEPIDDEIDGFKFKKCVFSGMDNLTTIPEGILKGKENSKKLIGLFANTKIETIPNNMFNDAPNLEDVEYMFALSKIPNGVDKNLFAPLKKVTNFSYNFYKSTGLTDFDISELLSSLTALKNADYLFAYSDLNNVHVDTFRFNTNLVSLMGTFEGTLVANVPTMFTYNKNLEDVRYIFKGTQINRTPDELFANKPKLLMVSGAFMDCSVLGTVSGSVFTGSTAIVQAENLFKNCIILRKVPTTLFESFINCENINGLFEGCIMLATLDLGLMDYFVKVETAERIFKDCTMVPILPSEFLKALSECTTLNNAFSGLGSLGFIGENVLPPNNKLRDASEMFKNQFNLTELPSDLFINSPNLEYLIGTFEGLTGLVELPRDIIKNNPNVTDVTRMFKQTGIKEVPKDYFINNTKIKNTSECFAACGNIIRLGKPFITLNDTYTEFDFRSMFYNCINLNLHYDKIGSYVKGIERVVDPVSIQVESMFEGVKTFLDEARVWEGINKIGDSKLTYTPPPSTKIDGLNKLGIIITPGIDPIKTTYNIIEIGTVKGIVTSASQFKGRIVIEVDGVRKAYEAKIYADEEAIPIALSDGTSKHTINIYTESHEDLVYIQGLYKEFDSDDTESDKNIWIRSESPGIEIVGSLNTKASVTTGYSLYNMSTLFTDTENIVPYPITKIPMELIKNLDALPRKSDLETDGFFSNLMIEAIPDGLLWKDYIKRNSKFEPTVGLFANCTKLKSVKDNLLSNMYKVTDISYMFYGCTMLDNIPKLVTVERPVNNIEYMFCNCISLKSVNKLFFSDFTNNLNISGLFKGCVSLSTLDDTIFNSVSVTYNKADEMFMDSGLTKIPSSLVDMNNYISSMRYMFKNSKITSIPDNFFSGCQYLYGNETYSSVEGMFSDIKTLTTIEGSLGLNGAVKNIKEIFANSINLKWTNHLVARFLFVAYPNECYVEDSFKNVHVNWDNNDQLFTPIKYIGESNAIFDGRLIPGTGTDGMNELIIHVDATNLNSSETTDIALYRWGVPESSLFSAENLIVEPDSRELIASTDLKNRLVVKVYDGNTLLSEIGYDKTVEESYIERIKIKTDKEYTIKIYTHEDYVAIKGTPYNYVKVDGTLPPDAFDGNTMIPLYKQFGTTLNNCNIIEIGGSLLNNSGLTSMDLSNEPFKSNKLQVIGSGLFDILVDQTTISNQFSNITTLTTIPKDILKGMTNLVKCRNMFKNCENLDVDLTGFFDGNLKIKDLTGNFSHTGITSIPEGLFDKLEYLVTTAYLFEYTKITSIPDELFRYNLELLSVAEMFRDTKITAIPMLHLNPTCYELARIFFNCTYLDAPYSLTIVNGLYNGTNPVESINLLDCFYNVPVRFESEGEFVEGIRFMTGATGAIFLKKKLTYRDLNTFKSQIQLEVEARKFVCDDLTIECIGFKPVFPDFLVFKKRPKEIIIRDVGYKFDIAYFGWRNGYDKVPIITAPECVNLNGFMYQTNFGLWDDNFWKGLQNVVHFSFNTCWTSPNIEDLVNSTNIFKGAPKSLISLRSFTQQDGSPLHWKCDAIRPIAGQLQAFTAFRNIGIPTFEDGFWDMFDWSKMKSISEFPGEWNLRVKIHLSDDLIKHLKEISEDRVVFIKDEKYDLSGIPDGKFNVYNSFMESKKDLIDNWDEIPDYMITKQNNK